jgi:hypothetical protein
VKCALSARILKYLGMFFLFSPLVLSGCKNGAPEQSSIVSGHVNLAGWPEKKVRACWKDVHDDHLGIIQNFVQWSFKRYTNFKVSGQNGDNWETCPQNVSGLVPISVEPLNVKALAGTIGTGIGYQEYSDGKPLQQSIKIDKKYWENSITNSDLLPLLNTFLHEFGHVAGLVHEHLRTSTTPECSQAIPGFRYDENSVNALISKYGGKLVFSLKQFDSRSVMAYCALASFAKADAFAEWSEGDLLSLQTLYGKPQNVQPKRDLKYLLGRTTLDWGPCGSRPGLDAVIQYEAEKACAATGGRLKNGAYLLDASGQKLWASEMQNLHVKLELKESEAFEGYREIAL